MRNRPELVPGVIRATISSDENEVIVRISDQGDSISVYTGLRLNMLFRRWPYAL